MTLVNRLFISSSLLFWTVQPPAYDDGKMSAGVAIIMRYYRTHDVILLVEMNHVPTFSIAEIVAEWRIARVRGASLRTRSGEHVGIAYFSPYIRETVVFN